MVAPTQTFEPIPPAPTNILTAEIGGYFVIGAKGIELYTIRIRLDTLRFMKKRASISLCMIVLNEEKFLKRSLTNAAPYVDEIIIVDGGSKDKTLEIAKSFKAQVFRAPWKEDFAAQRNISLKHAKKDWILVIDADEVCEKRLLEDLQSLAQNNIGVDAFAFPRKNYIDEKQTAAYPDRQTRFFKRDKKIRYERPLHEAIVGFRRIASPMDLHIIHRKTSERQALQNAHYDIIEKSLKK